MKERQNAVSSMVRKKALPASSVHAAVGNSTFQSYQPLKRRSDSDRWMRE